MFRLNEEDLQFMSAIPVNDLDMIEKLLNWFMLNYKSDDLLGDQVNSI